MENLLKLVLISLVVLISLIDLSESLNCVQCSSCSNPHSNTTNAPTACPSASTDTCIKTAIVYPGGSIIQKGCVTASACSATSLNIAGYGFWITCCTTDSCNYATNIKPSISTVMGFSLFVLINKILLF